MANSLDKKGIPEELLAILDVKSPRESKELIEKVGRFISNLVGWDFVYDRETDMEFSHLEELVTAYNKLQQRMKVPSNVGLLDTRTYKDPNGQRNPHIIEKLQAFWLLRNREYTEEQKNEHKHNYIGWLRNMLLIDQVTAEKIGENEIEERANKYIHRAIHHVNKLWESFEDILDDDAKSSYYSTIYNEKNSVYKLFWMIRNHLFAYRKLSRIKEPTPREIREKSNHNKALYEISRIFAFASMYIDIEHTPGRWTYTWDKVFLVSKILELMWNKQELSKDEIKEIIENDNPFFEYTETTPVFWMRKEDGWYEYFEKPFTAWKYKTHTAKFEQLSLTGKIGFKKQETINVLHTDFRSEKTRESSSEKILRKCLDGPMELPDTRGFRFVVETKEEAQKLFSLLAHELSSGPETAWIDEPKLQKNESSWENFECYKWTLKVFHKRGHMQEFIKHAKASIEDPTVRDRLEYLFSDQQWRILGTEIQIFIGKDSYIAAHHDKQSPAYHTNYKVQQLLDVLALLFPPAIFPETYDRIITHLVGKKTEKILEKIAKKISTQQNLTLFPLQSPETSPDPHL